MTQKTDYKYLNGHQNPVIVINGECRALFVNRRYIRGTSLVIKSLPLLKRGGVAVEELLNIGTGVLKKIKSFVAHEVEKDDALYIHRVTDRDSIIVRKINDGNFMLEIVTCPGSGDVSEPADDGKSITRGLAGIFGSLTPSILPDREVKKQDIYELVVNNSIDGFFLTDDRFIIINCNRSFERFFAIQGWEKTETSIYGLVAPESRKILRKKLQSVVKNRDSDTVEVVTKVTADARHYLLSINTMADDRNGAVRIYGFARDITQIKNLQYQLEVERNYNRGIIEKVNLGFVFVDDENRYLDFNEEYLRILDRDESELRNRNFYTFTAPEFIEKQKILMREMIRTGKSFIFEKEFIRRDGSTVPVQVSLSRLYDREGKPVGNFAFIRDISEQKEFQRKLIEHNTKIQNMITLYNELTASLMFSEKVHDVFEVLGRSISGLIGPAALEILYKEGHGFTAAHQAHGMIIKNRDRVLDGKISLIIKKIEDRRNPIFISDVPTELNDEDIAAFSGLLNHRSAMFLPMVSQNSVAALIILSFDVDINELDDISFKMLMGITNLGSIIIERIKYLEEQNMLKAALDRYERLTAMGRIIAGVAHEINNPLSIMQLDLDELKSVLAGGDKAPNAVCAELVQSMQEEISRLSGIVKQLKDYSSPETIGLEVIQVDDVFKSFPVKVFLKNLQKKGISLNLSLNAGRAAVQIPRNRLIQVLMNLLTNADDAIEQKENGIITVETGKTFREGSMVFISVRDNGMGISDENAKKIFEPFFTTKKMEGTGLGLSISYSIIKSHNGEIIMTSEESRGSNFTLYFPEAVS